MSIVNALLSASALLLALLLLRPLLKRYLSARARCALWAIPALRLLLPVKLTSAFTLLRAAAPVREGAEAVVNMPTEIPAPTWLASGIGLHAQPGADAVQNSSAAATAEATLSWGTVLAFVWLLGALAMLAVFLWQNIRFFRALRREAVPVQTDCRPEIWLAEQIPSPCLAGLFRPRIYINSAAACNGRVLDMTLLHERMHYKRLDHVWGALRTLLTVLYWFHPLVWLGGELFRRDSEMACDEAVTKRMTDDQRKNYGMALIVLASRSGEREKLLCHATFSGGKKLLKERIRQLARGRKAKAAALLSGLLALLLCCSMCALPEEVQLPDENADAEIASPEDTQQPDESLNGEVQTPAPAAEDLAWHLELSAPDCVFTEMPAAQREEILAEYGELLEGYELITRSSTDGKTAYVAGKFSGEVTESPLYMMYAVEMLDGETATQVLYREEDAEAVSMALVDGSIPAEAWAMRKSFISFHNDSGTLLIQPRDTEINLDYCFSRYLNMPNGRAYIADAAARGIALNDPPEPYLCVSLISENFGELTEKIPLTAELAEKIRSETVQQLVYGHGFTASLHDGGETQYFTEQNGVPQTVLDLAVEKCGYRFESPGDITAPVESAVLECSWLDKELRADQSDLPRLEEILKNAEFMYVGACGYGAKLTLTLADGKTMTVFKGTDGCDTIVFGSYGGYALGDAENQEFWAIFGLDAETKLPLA